MSGSAPQDQADGVLVKAAKRGSMRAFTELVRRYERAVFVFLCRIANDPGQAEDWTQETFLKAWSRLAQCRDPDAVRSWLYAIAARTALEQRRKLHRSAARDTAWAELRDEVDTNSDSAAMIDLQAALARLPDKDRVTAALIFGAGLTQAEAATVLGTPLGTVKTRMNRARARLAKQLKAWKPEP